MDALYRGIETSLLAFTLILGFAAFALVALIMPETRRDPAV